MCIEVLYVGGVLSEPLCSIGVWGVGYVNRYVPVGGVSVL